MRLTPAKQTTRPRRRKTVTPLKASMSRAASNREIEAFDEEEGHYENSEPNMKLSHAFIVVLILHVIAVGGVFGFNAMKSRQQALTKITAEASAKASIPAAPIEKTPATTQLPVKSVPTQETLQPAAPSISSEDKSPQLVSQTPTTERIHEVAAGDTLSRIAGKYGTTVTALRTANNLSERDVIRVGEILHIPPTAERSTPATIQHTPDMVEPITTQQSPHPQQSGTVTTKPTTQQPKPIAQVKQDTTATKSTAKTSTKPSSYQVAKGDTPYSIAKKFHISSQKLLEVNNIDDPTKLQIGQKLKIP